MGGMSFMSRNRNLFRFNAYSLPAHRSRHRNQRTAKLVCLIGSFALFICFVWSSEHHFSTIASVDERLMQRPALPTDPFSPSNARTEDGNFIQEDHFIPAARCASCHKDTHRFWSESLHRNAAREPFYRESADILLRTRGIEFTRHCESCHTPVALFSGALTRDAKHQEAPFTRLDDEGVTCSVCHSITSVRLDGTGSFTIRRPALLAREDETPVYGDFTDEQILADIPAHKRAVMRPLLRKPEFCAVCHKVDAPRELNGYKRIRGFSAYDEWQQSGASLESITPFYRRDRRADCRACHMPKVESANDRAAKNGMIASHRWLGANTAAPLFYDQREQVRLTEEFLKARVLDVDIFAIRNEATGEMTAPIDHRQSIALRPNEEITVEVVVSNRNAAHSFPPEVRDLYESWVEFEAIDREGRRIFHSGYVKPDGMLDETAHVYKTILLDEEGRHITRHQIWLTSIKAYDNAIQAGRSDVARFRFRVPPSASRSMKLRAGVNYRRLNQEYTDYVLKRRNRLLSLPVVQMAESVVVLSSSNPQSRRQSESSAISRQSERWNDYGIGLLEQSQYGSAAEAFGRASALDPLDSTLIVNRAIAEMRTERFGPEREQIKRAAELLDRALMIAPTDERARFYRALVLRAEGKMSEAASELRRTASLYPRDREVQRELAQTLYTLGRLKEARFAMEAVIQIDPTDANAYQFLTPIYASEGRRAEADRARWLYLQWRDDPRAERVAARFFASHPEWAEERIQSHTHAGASPLRPVLTGQSASPDR